MCLTVTNSIFWAQQGLWSGPVRVQWCDHHTSAPCVWVTALAFWEVSLCPVKWFFPQLVYIWVFSRVHGVSITPFPAGEELCCSSYKTPLGLACTGSPLSAAQWSCISHRVRLVVPGVQPQHWGFLFQCPLSKFFGFLVDTATTELLSVGSVPALGCLSCQQFLLWFTAQFGLLEWMWWWVSCPCWYQSWWVVSSQSGTCQTAKRCYILKALKANGLF